MKKLEIDKNYFLYVLNQNPYQYTALFTKSYFITSSKNKQLYQIVIFYTAFYFNYFSK